MFCQVSDIDGHLHVFDSDSSLDYNIISYHGVDVIRIWKPVLECYLCIIKINDNLFRLFTSK